MKGVTLSGRYTLERSLATGGMGTVWLARDDVLHRPVAVKLLNEGLVEDARASERFRREAMTAASITHPRMANVFDYLDHDGRPGIVMEYVDGETLAARIARDAPLSPEHAVRIATSVLEALQAAHDAGIIHRDIKPGNILLTAEGDVKVTDFGIARALGDATLTQAGMLMGTPHYVAPEQIGGAPASPATDVYAIGAVLYEMLTARRPFEADTPVAVAMARMGSDPVAPSTLHLSIPAQIDTVVMRALARDPADRFDSADEMRRALSDASFATQVLRVLPTDQTVELSLARSKPSSPGALPVAVKHLRPWLIPAAGIVAVALAVASITASVGDRPAVAGSPTRTPARVTPTPTARAPQPPRTVAAAVADLIAVVNAGDRRDQIDDEVAEDIVTSAREIEDQHRQGDHQDAFDEFRTILDTLEQAADDEEITSQRLTLIGAALTDLVRLLEREADEAPSNSDGDKKPGKGKGRGRH